MGEWMSSRDIESSFTEPLLKFVGSINAVCEQMRDRQAPPILLNTAQARRSIQHLCFEFLHELEGKNRQDELGMLRRRGASDKP
jgi:hypothetical protein